MARTLRYVGIFILAITAWLLIADLCGWLPTGAADFWARKGAIAGAACLVAGVLLQLFAPVGREMHRGRCVRCGHPIERGQAYCRDHLKRALDEIRDQSREAILHRPADHRRSDSSSS